MHIISMLLLPALLCVLRGVSAGDPVPTFVHRDTRTGETLTCNKCPPGEYMSAYCTATTPTQCAPCRNQHFTELWNYLPRCLYCYTFCSENQEVETECTATTNRVCRCKQGFYATGDFCMRHSECGPGHGVKTNGTLTMNTVCEKCADGYFSTSSSAVDQCVKHQGCATGQIALLPGSIYQDTMCGSCEDLANVDTLRAFFQEFFSMNKLRPGRMKLFLTRYIQKADDVTLPGQRGPVLDQIRAWLAQATVEQLKSMPQMLTDSKLCVMREKLEKIVSDIKQQSPSCTVPFL
ncbi:tumor necrosis factor receptor superfamily member 6B-like [Centropristis striata]|uniref:tumor necrosis factor receptor superfamily member 6B-like n=1 Tax=Centropristis striata TaxID=184440 RepID=UPI0027DFFAB7|nr:tumor necrosis factor receptor superfamily member 6B-like [Centropristis striata]